MRSQFEFFMSELDEEAFVAAFVGSVSALKKESERQWMFCAGDGEVQLLRCFRSRDEITLGRIAVATHAVGATSQETSDADRLFKRMRSRLKKEYSNRLIAVNTKNPGRSTPYRNVWLGPDARVRHRSGLALRSSVGDSVVWKEEPNQTPHPTTL